MQVTQREEDSGTCHSRRGLWGRSLKTRALGLVTQDVGPGAGHSRRGLQRMISRGWGWFYFSVTAEQSSLVESLKRTVTLLVSISQGSSLSIIVFSSRGLAKCLWAAFTSGAQGSLPSSPVGRIQFIPHRSLSFINPGLFYLSIHLFS